MNYERIHQIGSFSTSRVGVRANVCDDGRMKLQGFRPLDRGEISIFAALVLIAILGATGLFLQSATPSPLSQTATATTKETTGKLSAAEKNTACEKAKQNAADAAAKNGGATPTREQKFSKDATEQDKCVGAVLIDKAADATKPGSYRCVGMVTVITLKKGNANTKEEGVGTIKSDPGDKRVYGSTINDKDVPEGKCLSSICDVGTDGKSQGCSAPKEWNGTDKLKTFLSKPEVFLGLSPDQQAGVLEFGAMSKSTQEALANAYNDKFWKLEEAYDAIDKAQQDCLSCKSVAIPNEIAEAAGIKCDGVTASSISIDCNIANPQRQLEQIAAKQKELDEQIEQLKKSTVTLDPNNQDPNKVPPGAGAGAGGASGGGTGNTFGSGNGLSSLLGGLAKGLGSSMAQQSAPAQTCSTDPTVYAQQQQQYQQQMQQYNYQLQQYNYQQQLNSYYGNSTAPIAPTMPSACTPSTQQQCSLQPQQPAASGCSGGSWQPVYSGNCIVNWQCTNLGAEISCQPQTADVGMQIAISYSCAQGTASGSGFTASGQSGTTTATVAQPPAGANTATYGLTCSMGSATSGAQCSVQVVQPSIVLVANPAMISSGGTSLLGWITTGMQSCVVSSPNDAAFTAQNASNTSANGTAQTLAATTTKNYLLSCQTLSGGTRAASTTVSVQ